MRISGFASASPPKLLPFLAMTVFWKNIRSMPKAIDYEIDALHCHCERSVAISSLRLRSLPRTEIASGLCPSQ